MLFVKKISTKKAGSMNLQMEKRFFLLPFTFAHLGIGWRVIFYAWSSIQKDFHRTFTLPRMENVSKFEKLENSETCSETRTRFHLMDLALLRREYICRLVEFAQCTGSMFLVINLLGYRTSR